MCIHMHVLKAHGRSFLGKLFWRGMGIVHCRLEGDGILNKIVLFDDPAGTQILEGERFATELSA